VICSIESSSDGVSRRMVVVIAERLAVSKRATTGVTGRRRVKRDGDAIASAAMHLGPPVQRGVGRHGTTG
jgi:hypothetical protein